MKPTPNSPTELSPILAFGAHPDDIEFGCGGVIFKETRSGRAAHFVVCSRGEAATNGTPDQRVRESKSAAKILGASIELIKLDGDAHLQLLVAHTIKLADIIRRRRPGIVLAPTPHPNQHPDHSRLSAIVRDATRLARYGGVAELRKLKPHTINQLLFYSQTDSEPGELSPILVDISDPKIVKAWKAAMEAHASQGATRNYVELQLTRARLNGLRAGIGYAMPLYPNEPLVVDSLKTFSRAARQF